MPESIPQFQRGTFLDYIKLQKKYDADLRAILRDASREAGKLIEGLPGDGVGVSVRRAQFLSRRAALHDIERDLWGNVRGVIREGLSSMAELAGEQDLAFIRLLTSDVSTQTVEFRLAAERAVKNVQARQELGHELSERVYRNRALTTGKVDQVVNQGIVLGKSAKEIAADVSRFIRPDTPGGTSYAAMRLGRTELNNAFHTTNQNIYKDHPWIENVSWNLSGSHPTNDICNDLAEGGPYPADKVPDKPHPHCLCYTMVVGLTRDVFVKNLLNGDYDDWIVEQGYEGILS